MILSATVGSSSITLTDGNPFKLLSATGMGGADIRRVSVAGPSQVGDTDLGYRLAPREIELVLGFQGSSDSVLDGYRDTLTQFFKPLTATPVTLTYTRDDGVVRSIACNLVGSVKIDLLPVYRPGHYHRATIRLRAPDPAWYNSTASTASYSGTAPISNWWLAGGAVGTAQVLMQGGTPANNEAWSYTGTVTDDTGFTLAVRAEFVSYLHSSMFMFDAPTLGTEYVARFGVAGTETWGTVNPYYRMGPSVDVYGVKMFAGTNNYFYHTDTNPAYPNTQWRYQTSLVVSLPGKSHITGAAQKWRTNSWPGAVQVYALYSPPLTTDQMAAVSSYMGGTAGTANQNLVISYLGDLPEYPVISITGPVTGPSITNTATGEVLNFGTNVIGAGTTYVIDTRYGYKTILEGTVSRRDKLSSDSNLSTWHLAPNPIATGGTNTIVVNGTGLGSATAIQVVYYNRYMSF